MITRVTRITRVSLRIVQIGCLATLLFFTCASVNAQLPASPAPASSPSPATNIPDAAAQPANDPARPLLYGLQGAVIETLDGKTVSSQSADMPFNPASAIKLATALVALKSLGPRYRFMTGFWTDGVFDKSTGTLRGNLYVSGRDPSFHFEHAVFMARQLNRLGIRTVTGDLIVAPRFTMNFNWSARRSGEKLYDVLDATLRPAAAESAWSYSRSLARENIAGQPTPSVAVMGEVAVSTVPAGARLLSTHHSSTLIDVLKVLLCYSNNFMAERLGDSIGGVRSVREVLLKSLSLAPNDLRLASLSGLGVNRVTPTAMMKIFRALRTELRRHRLSTADILPVAGIDPGTLEKRFTEMGVRGSVIAKTGTLVRTDGGVSSLVGQLNTASGQVLLFVIFNQRGSVLRFRDNQDLFVRQVQDTRGGPKPFTYRPIALAMKLTDTHSTVEEGKEEFEPVTAVESSP